MRINAEIEPKILIIDDDVTSVKYFGEILNQYYDVSFASNAQSGLTLARSTPSPDLILLDVLMPNVDGFTLCKQLKNDPATQKIPVIFVTSAENFTDQIRGFEVGGVDYIHKPVHAELLKKRIEIHLQLYFQTQELEQLAAQDPLTRISNHRKFDQVYAQEWRKCGRSNSPMSLLYIDLDNFKAYNDNYGHGKGDECLVILANLLKRACHRPADLPARLGGEEFCALLPDTTSDGAKNVANTLLEKLSEANITHAFNEHYGKVTASIGVASVIPSEQLDERQLLEKADKAMYHAKQHGRNRVFVWLKSS